MSRPRLTTRTESGTSCEGRASADVREGFWYDVGSTGMNDNLKVRLSVPGTLQYRDVVLRVVDSVCRLFRSSMKTRQEASHRTPAADFDHKVVSAVGEAFNNIAIHGYSGGESGNAEVELSFDDDTLQIRISDTGRGFDFSGEIEPDLRTLPESHMGILIIRACMDDVDHVRGIAPAPNVLTLTKRYFDS